MASNADKKLRAAEVAKLVGIATDTWHGYVSRDQAPHADGHFDSRTPYWLESTVQQWMGTRRGRGRRRSADRA